MSKRYASNTEVPSDRSRLDIERVLMNHGARGFGYETDTGRVMITFRVLNEIGALVAVQISLTMPCQDDEEFTKTPTGKNRSENQAYAAYEQACRSSWRQLLLIIRAKMEAVAAGISTIEREFMPDIVIGKGGRTLGQWMEENQKAIEAGGKIPLLPAGSQ